MAPGRSRLPVRFALGALAVAALALAGCSPLNQGAVELDEATGRPALVLALCEDEVVERVELRDPTVRGNTRLLWAARADRPRAVERVVVGNVPSGFTEEVPLAEDLPPRLSLRAEVEGGLASRHGGSFRLAALDEREVSMDQLRDHARANCSNNLLDRLGLPRWLWYFPLGMLVLAGVIIAVLVKRSIRPRPLPRPPPAW